MKNIITLIIGLPGSGKTTLLEYYKKNPFIDYVIYNTWNNWTYNNVSNDKFTADIRLKELEKDIEDGNNILIECVEFCDYKFLHNAELYLTSKFINIKVERVYFENNLESAILNIRYRDKKRGGHWKNNELGIPYYYGQIFNFKPLYRVEIQNANRISKDYIIPINYKPLPILVQK